MSNILLYSGPGVSTTALAHTKRALQELCPSYDVRPTSAIELALAPWQSTTSLVVLPGGRDLPFVDELGKQRRKEDGGMSTAQDVLREWVEKSSGSFLGICAGGYFASSRCVFEPGTPMEVIGSRDGLQFYPGECQGTVYKGFLYESDRGARVVRLDTKVGRRAMHYNGGGAFMHADQYQEQGVTILAAYPTDDEEIAHLPKQRGSPATYAGQAAVVHCKVGSGQAILFGTHPEFSLLPNSRPVKLTAATETLPDPSSSETVEQQLIREDLERKQFLADCLEQLGIRVQRPATASLVRPSSTELASQGKLSTLFWTGDPQTLAASLQAVQSLQARSQDTPRLSRIDALLQEETLSIQDSNDSFHLVSADPSLQQQASEAYDLTPFDAFKSRETGDVDLHSVPKYILLSEPGASPTPHWNSSVYFTALEASKDRLGSASSIWSSQRPFSNFIQYGERVTSTQTMLDKNPRLLEILPEGFVSFATHQISGRGRGGNSWISPLGCLQFSLVLHVPTTPRSAYPLTSLGTNPTMVGSKLVFVQYLAGLAIIEGIRKGLGPEYEPVGRKVRLKWPNDIYAQVQDQDTNEEVKPKRTGVFQHLGKTWAKMGGILVNSQYRNGNWHLIVGCGVNCLNPLPTVSLSALIDDYNTTTQGQASPLPHVSQELLAGAILASFECLWNEFLLIGDWSGFSDRYRQYWLHSDQITTLTTTSPPQTVRILGITSDTGLLRAIPIDHASQLTSEDTAIAWGRSRGRQDGVIDLQPDGNSFDMLANLIKTKT